VKIIDIEGIGPAHAEKLTKADIRSVEGSQVVSTQYSDCIPSPPCTYSMVGVIRWNDAGLSFVGDAGSQVSNTIN
jgi:hypothetical protein